MADRPGTDPIVEVTEAEGYVRIGYRDLISMEKQMRLVDLIYGIYRSEGHSKFLVDTRGCPISYSIIERHQVALYFADKLKSEVAVAFIIDKEHWTGLPENAARNRGGSRVKIAFSEGEALDWMGSE